MKLIVAGSTGFVATELIRQALSHPAVTSVVALGRRQTAVPPGADPAQLKSVVCDDFEHYSDNVKQELAGADACVWTIGVTPARIWNMSWDHVCKVSRDYAVAGIETISRLPRHRANGSLRFIYMSGSNAERDAAKKPWVLGEYCLMRGDTESRILAFAQQSEGAVQAVVAKPGLIDGAGKSGSLVKAVQSVGCSVVGLPKVHLKEVAAALLDQAVNGFEKDTLLNDDLVHIGQRALALTQQTAS